MLRLLIICTTFLLINVQSTLAEEKLIYGVFWEGCEHGCQGFIDAMEISGFPARIELRDAKQNKEDLTKFVDEARELNADLVLTYGTSATLGLAGRHDDTDMSDRITDRPLVFMYVSDPIGSKIAKDFKSSGRSNIAGTYNRVPEAVNIKTIRTILPEFSHLGMIYNLNERNSVLKVDELKRLSGKMDFQLTALEIDPGNSGVPDPKLISERVEELASAGVDFIYLGSSSYLRINGAAFTSSAVEYGLPVLSPYEEVVRENDALISIAARAADVGEIAAKLALQILRDGKSPGDLPIARVTDFAYVVNMEVAKQLNLYPPIDFMQLAETVK